MRLFVAMDIPEAVLHSLRGLTAESQKLCRDARWTTLQGAHVTLKFIGEVSETQARNIRGALGSVHAPGPIELRFAGLGFFPNERRPRVFWAGIEGGAALAGLARAIEDSLAPLDVAREERDFRPHITLARFTSPRGTRALRAAAAAHASAEFGSSRAGEFYLYQSILKRSGAEYTRLAAYPLSGERTP